MGNWQNSIDILPIFILFTIVLETFYIFKTDANRKKKGYQGEKPSSHNFSTDKYKLYKEMDIIKFLNDFKELKAAVKKLGKRLLFKY